MMHGTATLPGRRPASRGFVLLIAISVLAILTILVFGLAASQDQARNRAALDNARHVAAELASVALDSLGAAPAAAQASATTATAAAAQPAAAGATEVSQEFPEGRFVAVSRPVAAGEPCYTPPLLAHRDGDRVVALCVSVPLKTALLRFTQVYLVNTTAEKARRVLLRETPPAGFEWSEGKTAAEREKKRADDDLEAARSSADLYAGPAARRTTEERSKPER